MFVILVVAAGVVVGASFLPTSDVKTATKRKPVASVVTVVARPNLTFDQGEYFVPAGPVELRLKGAPGIAVGFADHRVSRCVVATGDGAPHSCRVVLRPGRYTIWDTIPGHRAGSRGDLVSTIVALPG